MKVTGQFDDSKYGAWKGACYTRDSLAVKVGLPGGDRL